MTFNALDAYDDDSTGQPHVDPDRIPTPLEVPLTMRQLVFPPEQERVYGPHDLDAELEQHSGEAGGWR
jgi:hypothetical protein